MVMLNNNPNNVQFGPGNNTVFAGGGNDRVRGDGGNDRLFGQQGDDVLRGQADDDRLFGGAGDDRLFGGPGEDRVHAGPGADDVVYTNINHIDGDRLSAFNGGPGGDRIDLSAIDANLGTPDVNEPFAGAGFLGSLLVSNAGQVQDGEIGLIYMANNIARVVVNQGGGPTVSLVVEDIDVGSSGSTLRLGDFLL